MSLFFGICVLLYLIKLSAGTGFSTIKDPVGMMQRWNEHLTNLFFNPSVVNDSVIKDLPQRDILHQMDRLPTRNEVHVAIKQNNIGKLTASLWNCFVMWAEI